MKRILFLLASSILLFCCNTFAQQISKAEYFFDTDPGVGNGTALTVTTGDSVLFSGSVSSSGLPAGFHLLYIRARNTAGVWSLVQRRMLFIRTVNTTTTLTATEYFFDTDPGVGNGTSISVSTGDTIQFSGTISTTGLNDGFHFLYIRARDVNGNWSLSQKRMFFIFTTVATSPTAAAEYFFDADPGVGNGTGLTVTGGDTMSFSGLIPSGVLAPGFHYLCIRVRAVNGTWSIIQRRMFYIQAPPAVSTRLVAAEYFIDTDPGIGNATSIAVTPGDSIDFSGPIIPADTNVGNYKLYIRVRDSLNVWSLYAEQDFEISHGIGVHDISASDKSILFQNFPNPFSRSTTIQFYLQEAADVTLFITDFLGREVSMMKLENPGQGMHELKVDDAALGNGYYFYRLVSGDFRDTKRMIVLKQ